MAGPINEATASPKADNVGASFDLRLGKGDGDFGADLQQLLYPFRAQHYVHHELVGAAQVRGFGQARLPPSLRWELYRLPAL